MSDVVPLLEVRGLRKTYPVTSWRGVVPRRRRLCALDGVDLTLRRGDSLALVGESGSGKSTLARCALRLLEADAGVVRFDGVDLGRLDRGALRRRRHRFQMVFQDAGAALDPRLTVAASLAEALRCAPRPVADVEARAVELLASVGLDAELAGRHPHQLSGGQRQRVGIARALATEPELLVLDEPVSALDVTVRRQVLALIADLRRRLGLTVLVIGHDLSVVSAMAERVAVLYLGRVVEEGPVAEVFGRPRHPYTAALVAAAPRPDPRHRRRRPQVRGEIPSPLAPPPGCVFHPRCPVARPHCAARVPRLEAEGAVAVACFHPGEVAVERQRGSVPPRAGRESDRLRGMTET